MGPVQAWSRLGFKGSRFGSDFPTPEADGPAFDLIIAYPLMDCTLPQSPRLARISTPCLQKFPLRAAFAKLTSTNDDHVLEVANPGMGRMGVKRGEEKDPVPIASVVEMDLVTDNSFKPFFSLILATVAPLPHSFLHHQTSF
jgi:hypothetical protein